MIVSFIWRNVRRFKPFAQLRPLAAAWLAFSFLIACGQPSTPTPAATTAAAIMATAVPPTYLPANAPFRRRTSLRKLIFEAERAVKAEDNVLW